MLDHVIGSWRTRKFSRVLAVEHELAHVMPKLPKAAERRVIDDTVITIYRI